MIALIDKFNQVEMSWTNVLTQEPTPELIDVYKGVPEINELDNRGFPICRPLFSHSSLPNQLGFNLIKSDEFDYDTKFTYFVHVHHNQKLWAKHIDLIPKKILEEVRKEKCTLVFDNTLEGDRIDGRHLLLPLYGSINKLNLPGKQIVFITNDLNAEKSHEYFLTSGLIKEPIKVISFMWNVHDVDRLRKHKFLRKIKNIDTEINYKKKNIKKVKSFLKVNRTNRPERDLFMLFIEHENLYDKFKISFPQFGKETFPSHDEFKKYLTPSNINSLLKKIPFDIDETDETNHGPAGYGKGNFNADLPFQPIHYRNTFISVVMGAFPFVENCCHLHSSTFNPIYQGHPIIQFGPYKSLERIKERGFKTFDKWWDESYDDIKNGWERFGAVLKLVKKLSEKSNQELLEMYVDMKDVLQHNIDLINQYDINLLKEKI
tara:strand:- start:519 stop:1814 length:1296 start_codon:yes stop_codon:yes gene_type:complete